VLGIDNPYLLREIHQSDEIVVKDKLYSYQMMQQESHHQEEKLMTIGHFGGGAGESQH
jgi:hypothetical protein